MEYPDEQDSKWSPAESDADADFEGEPFDHDLDSAQDAAPYDETHYDHAQYSAYNTDPASDDLWSVLPPLEQSADLNEPRPARRSKARERIERRRGQMPGESGGGGGADGNRATKPMTMVAPQAASRANPRTTPRAVPQGDGASAGRGVGLNIRLPDRPREYLRLLIYIGGAALLFFGVLFGLGSFSQEETVTLPNAIWLGTEWTYAERSDAEIVALAGRLRAHQVGTVYAWVSWIKGDGEWAGQRSGTNEFAEMEAAVSAFVQQFKTAYPEASLYAWIGFPVEAANIPYRLDNTALHDAVAAFSLRTVRELGFDGVFLNVEPVWNRNADDFIRFLGRVRVELGTDIPISVAIPPDWTPLGVNIPQPALVTPGTEWDKAFKQRVALLTDELAIMAYNSGLTSPVEYIDWMAYQVSVYAAAVHELDIDTRIVIGIPTYDNELPGHDVNVENVVSAIGGVRRGLSQAGDAARVVSGLAIYAEWTTSETEWSQFRQGWVTP